MAALAFRRSLLSCVVALPALTRVVSSFTPASTNSLLGVQRSFNLKATSALKMSTSTSAQAPAIIPGRPTFQQVMLRIKDPEASLKMYTEHLGFTLIDTLDFPQYKFTLYFLTTLPKGETYDLRPGSQAAHDYLWSMEGVALELTHNHGTEADKDQKYHPGNQEKDGTLPSSFDTTLLVET